MSQASKSLIRFSPARLYTWAPAICLLFVLTACTEETARHYMDGPCDHVNETIRADPSFDTGECRIVNE